MITRIIDLIFELKSVCHYKESSICKELSLSPSEFRAILSLIPNSQINGNILSKKMGLSVSRGSRVIKKLLENRYIKENLNSDDNRMISVSLTQKGIKIQNKIHNMLDDCEKKILSRMSNKELKEFEKSINRISDILINN